MTKKLVSFCHEEPFHPTEFQGQLPRTLETGAGCGGMNKYPSQIDLIPLSMMVLALSQAVAGAKEGSPCFLGLRQD